MKATENEDMKRLINARLWYCINNKVGVQALAKQSGISPQTFYNIRDNSRMPHTDTVLAIKRAVSELNMELVYSENADLPMDALFNAQPPALAIQVSDDGIDWKTRCLEMESRFNLLIAGMSEKYDTLMSKYESLLEKTVRKLDPTLFKESDSQFTVFPSTRRLISMGRHDSPVTECIVRVHPATANQLRMLNSRMPVAVGVEG